MKNYLVSFLTIFILISCDGVESFATETININTMKGYLQCMKNNEEEVSFLGYTYVRDECASKHSKKGFRSPFTMCRASITTGFQPSVSISTCNNDTGTIITSLKVGISVSNVPVENTEVPILLQNKETISIDSEHKNIFIKPNQSIVTEILIDSSKLVDYPSLPFCSTEPKEICKDWYLSEYRYIPASIR